MTVDEREFDLVSEIVSKLRMGGPNAAEITDEAADTIDRLRTALAASEARLERAREALTVPASMIGSTDPYAKGYKDACYLVATTLKDIA